MTGLPLEVAGVTKRFGATVAVDDLSFRVEPGRVTGFLGPNGAGKTTTLRVLLGLVRADAGVATIGGRRYDELDEPARVVGSVLEAAGFYPGRSGRDHLRVLAAAGGLDDRRADEVLALVGLSDSARRRAGGYSLGMRQRLALATALLGEPQVLVLDEPANGLDPEGIRWLRTFLRYLAGEGRTVLVSSHVLAEVQQTVDDVVIIDHGRLVTRAALDDVTHDLAAVRVRSPDVARLATLLRAEGVEVDGPHDAVLTAMGVDSARVGELAAREGVVLHELVPVADDLESAFLRLTGRSDLGDVGGTG